MAIPFDFGPLHSDRCPRCGQRAQQHNGGPLCDDGIRFDSEKPYLSGRGVSFAGHPQTIGELRAVREQSAAAWAPRDILIDLLREIDSGAIHPTAMVVTMALKKDDSTYHGYRNATPDTFTALGLLTRTIYRLQEP